MTSHRSRDRHPIRSNPKEKNVSYPQLLTPEEMLTVAKERLDIPTIVVICGSTRFMDLMAEHEAAETAAGRAVFRPVLDLKAANPLWDTPAKFEAMVKKLDTLHRSMMRIASEVLVVGPYIGDHTRSEIAYARSLGIPVRFTHPEVDPALTAGEAA